MTTPTLTVPEVSAVWYLIATIIASLFANVLMGVAALVTVWMNRQKLGSDIRESRARAAKDFAEADEITLRASLTLSEEATHWTQKMMRAQRLIFQLQSENEYLKAENQRLKANDRKQLGSSR